MHGELLKKICTHCKVISQISGDLQKEVACLHCGEIGGLRPDIVWFGEMPYEMDTILQALMEYDLFVSIGTSGNVYPAAGFVEIANQSGARTVELNLEPSDQKTHFQEAHYGPATVVVPKFFESLK